MWIKGSCHCGNISFALDWAPEPQEIPARACSCSFCTKHGGVWTSCPGGSLQVQVREAALATGYRFGTGTAIFHVCARCGVVPVVSSRIDGRLYAVVSVNAMDALPVPVRHAGSSDFDGETEGERLARRARNWIAEVAFDGLEP